MKKRKIIIFLPVLTFISIGVYSCKHYYIKHEFRQTYTDANSFLHSDTTQVPFFKIHFKNGDVSILDEWNLNDSKDSIVGSGKLYDFNRGEIQDGALGFNIDNIAIIETNQLEAIKSKDKGRIAGLSILTGVNVILDLVCITNPKACFGSCPTFYLNGQETIHASRAEGFSSSISPGLEKLDLDALQHSTSSQDFSLTMKNEAFETHMVNQISLQAVPKHKNQSVYHDKNGKFYQCEKSYPFKKAILEKPEAESALSQKDDDEYFTATDPNDLSAKEEIILEFEDIPDEDLGIVINYRQTLLTTFLLYSGISYMGDEVGDYFAKIETNSFIKKRLSSPFKKLGGMNFYIWNPKRRTWEFIEELYETGPIAKNLTLVPIVKDIPYNNGMKIKIELTKGLWRLDYVGLTSINRKVSPVTLYPSDIEVIEGENYTPQDVRADDENYLVSFPGNEFKFKFKLPKISKYKEYELFLSSKGYYLEWIRRDWIKGKNLPKLKKMLMNDAQAWKELAKEFKTMEHEMETVFWNSKYTTTQ